MVNVISNSNVPVRSLDEETRFLQEYLQAVLEMQALDMTRFGDQIPNSRYDRCFCGHCAQPMRVRLSKGQLLIRERMQKYKERVDEARKQGKKKDPAFPATLAVLAFGIRSILCEHCLPSARPWKRAAKRTQRVREKLESIIDDDSC